ncbi:hypothetical protein SERLA73DRAFT_77010 [Serpula lacrymans var. lacrymans S7.3]|uniref:Uncharacterized protein n=2 Tax=Serpula lacrymans var. lacrymans TaxID=341189 RepID=F8Q8T8_SERL3|nr:uncharacterized protein SERLADRAFT_441827 [Serpula lacrymans var. lacrymans S7.9]EGN94993.1 hypothetical protein SERLA73DRAFT_77010 [Serpula lacrymans var. lacrymans S7.3]EGO20487.1 hypothetical protein SERLADRAFT_441827 [Serpula lacrymans var. lacrymans S7.9]
MSTVSTTMGATEQLSNHPEMPVTSTLDAPFEFQPRDNHIRITTPPPPLPDSDPSFSSLVVPSGGKHDQKRYSDRKRCQYTPYPNGFKSFSSPICSPPPYLPECHHLSRNKMYEYKCNLTELGDMPDSAVCEAYHAQRAGQEKLRCQVQLYAWGVVESSRTANVYRELLNSSTEALTQRDSDVEGMEEYMHQKGIVVDEGDLMNLESLGFQPLVDEGFCNGDKHDLKENVDEFTAAEIGEFDTEGNAEYTSDGITESDTEENTTLALWLTPHAMSSDNESANEMVSHSRDSPNSPPHSMTAFEDEDQNSDSEEESVKGVELAE